MDNFREWLSDNLRYILLGVVIILVLLLLFFGVRFLSAKFGDVKPEENQNTEQQADQNKEQGEDVNQAEPAPTEEATPTKEAEEDPLEKNVYPNVNALMQKYYTALGSRDVQTLKTLMDQLDPAEESAIVNSRYIEGYSSVEVYTKKGLTDSSYVVFACYGHKYQNYDTVLPGVSCLYVDSKEDGSLYIVSEPTEEQENRMTEATSAEDAQELLAAKGKEYDDTLASDEALGTYLSELGLEGSAAMEAETGTTITVKSNCNVREAASADSDKVGELVSGQEVKKTGQEGDWIQIEFNGQSGYVRGDLFK